MDWASGIFNKIVASVIILLIGFIIGKVFGKLIKRILHEAEADKLMRKTGIKISFERSFSQVVEYLIYFITIIIALNQLGVTAVILYILAVIVLLIIIISIILAIKDFIPNFIAGLTIKKRNLFKKGDYIKINSVQGKVSESSWLETRLLSKKDIIIIPNSLIIKSKITIRKKN